MSNKLYQAVGQNQFNPCSQIVGEISKFAETINGNPQQMVQKLLDSGEMSQKTFNELAQVARQIAPLMGVRYGE